MKKQYYFSLLLFIFSFPQIYSQCDIILDDSLGICAGGPNVSLADYFEVNGGTPPYQYRWHGEYHYSIIHYTASDILTDTTSSSPSILFSTENPFILHIEVTDAEGNICNDSISLTTCSFITIPEYGMSYISQGDSVQISHGLEGNCPFQEFLWSPDYNISDPTVEFPIVSPDTTTLYTLTVWDIWGCESLEVGHIVKITSSSNDSHFQKEGSVSIFPNPIQNEINLTVENINTYNFSLIDISGKVILEENNLSQKSKKIDLPNYLSNGVYFLKVFGEQGQTIIKKILVSR